ncbi:MAG: hypothetical protein ACM3PC_02475 [Deltaproteobacteria bacterium]
MTASVASFLTQAQKAGSELPPALSGALLLAAIRLSEHRQQALRPYQLLVDDDGTLELLAGEPPTADGYAAPELRAAAALPHDPRVLVYAAGALGYELVTLTPPRLSGEAGPELAGPFASVIRKAMSERRDRFRSLKEMALAVERVQARPTSDEERVILAAVASSTQLPPAQKLAKIELLRASGAAGPEPAPQMPAPFAPWDGLEPSAEMDLPAQAAEPRAGPADEPLEPPEVEKVHEETAVQPARHEELAKLQARLDELEQQVRSAPPPAATALAREVKLLLDERRFAEAERALQSPLTADDATLQLRLAQTLSSMPDTDGSRMARAEAAFRRAAELDPSWAQTRAGLGTFLMKQGKREEALAQFRAALVQDPACAEAQQGMAQSRPARARRDYRLVLSAALGAVAAIAVVLFFRPPARARAVSPSPQVAPPRVAQAEAQPPTQPPAPIPAPTPAAKPALAVNADPAPAPPGEPARSPAPAPPGEPARSPVPAPSGEPAPALARAPAPAREPDPDRDRDRAPRKPHHRIAAQSQAAKGEKALRAFDTKSAQSAFDSALKLDPTLPSAHRGMGMVYVLLGRNAEAKSEYAKYLKLAPDAPDKDQIERLLSR